MVYKKTDLPHLNINQSNRVNYRSNCNRYNIPMKVVQFKNNDSQGYTYNTNLITHENIDKINSAILLDDSRYNKEHSFHILENMRRTLDGLQVIPYINWKQLSRNVKKHDLFFFQMRRYNPKLFKYIGIIGKGKYDIGYKLYADNFRRYEDIILTEELKYYNRNQYSTFLYRNGIGSSISAAYSVIIRCEKGGDINFKSYRTLRSIIKVIGRSNEL